MEHPVVGPIDSAPEQAHQDSNILKTLYVGWNHARCLQLLQTEINPQKTKAHGQRAFNVFHSSVPKSQCLLDTYATDL
jgi:hypothetical protein